MGTVKGCVCTGKRGGGCQSVARYEIECAEVSKREKERGVNE